jgi:L-threonylcarbamoyladenylate synthase
METRIEKVPTDKPFGQFQQQAPGSSRLERWELDTENTLALEPLREAAKYLQTDDIPVAFPTETVYGLGADATRSGSVNGIYAAKKRPSDNPLIVHVCDLEMLRGLLRDQDGEGESATSKTPGLRGHATGDDDEIPSIYKPLIERFWPGPLTILLPDVAPANLAPEVTAGLTTFGARMPSSPLALSLIKLTGRPLAAPSANASTKPSPTASQHVKHDLDGRIRLILDGGPCQVGVESTVVDGLSDPPAVLRPGGLSMDELRTCPGWENVVKGYKDHSEEGKAAPRAPGMKYKHYSPKAKVILYEATYESGSLGVTKEDVEFSSATAKNGALERSSGVESRRIGVIRTRRWKQGAGLGSGQGQATSQGQAIQNGENGQDATTATPFGILQSNLLDAAGEVVGEVLDIDLGADAKGVAQGIFSALRELDLRGADTIFVDGIADESDIAEAVMNRLRKAASEIRA